MLFKRKPDRHGSTDPALRISRVVLQPGHVSGAVGIDRSRGQAVVRKLTSGRIAVVVRGTERVEFAPSVRQLGKQHGGVKRL